MARVPMSVDPGAAAMAVDAVADPPHYGPEERRSPVQDKQGADGNENDGAQTTAIPVVPTNDDRAVRQ